MSSETMFSSLTKEQIALEQRFNCIVCLCPRLQMVYGLCQHRVCVSCLYSESGAIRLSMLKCPICQNSNVFPPWKPDILEDTIELQKCLGIRQCSGCTMELWDWEIENHEEYCQKKKQVPKTPSNNKKIKFLTRSESARKSRSSTDKDCDLSPRQTRSRRVVGSRMLARLRSFRK
ncbi:hypothetical protein LOTGIDRAFT_234958 [Lottia gigantea]|uniref:RING-type domain-containing protein n=1 Tax=Lottia gigantea TaxID=225164 RepID=V4BFJ9_LOTGI|nr:hypothetical protein LOTGIDRAFT_234958 [Lottia gigantea]ESO87714.1 hypothetical protein LOTGIDRAFT_234958 [Lottia gigantea]